MLAVPRAGAALVSLVAVAACVLAAPSRALGAEGVPYAGDLGQAIATLVVFLILLAILGKWAWKPIVTQLRRHDEAAARQTEETEQREQRAKDLLALYEGRLKSAEAEAEKLLAESRKQGDAARQEMLTAANIEARKVADLAREEIAQARRDAMRELGEKTAELATDVAARVLAGSLTDADHRRLMDESVREIREKIAEDS